MLIDLDINININIDINININIMPSLICLYKVRYAYGII